MKAHWICLPLLLVAAPLAAQAVVTGTVEGTHGARVPQASVSVYNDEGVVVAYRVTDVSGRFTVHLPVGGTYRVYVIAEDFRPGSRTVRVQDDGTASTRIILWGRDSSGAGSSNWLQERNSVRQRGGGGSGGGKPPMPAGSDS